MRRLLRTGAAVALLLMVPRGASAGMGDIIDTIIGLRGPQMVGIPIACEVILKTVGQDLKRDQPKEKACYVAGFPVPWPAFGVDDDFWRRRDYWVSLGGGIYGSTGKDSPNGKFASYDTWMLALEPTFNFRTLGAGGDDAESRFVMEHGFGPTLFFPFGSGIDDKDFDGFANGGIKIKVLGLAWRNIGGGRLDIGAAYNWRFFPKGFTAQDFGADPGATENTDREIVHGFSFSISF